jgi:hypothetical protein
MYDARLRRRERATATAGGIVTRMRRDAVLIGGSVERLSQPRDRARPTEIPRSRTDPPSLLAAQIRRLGYGNRGTLVLRSRPDDQTTSHGKRIDSVDGSQSALIRAACCNLPLPASHRTDHLS